MFKKIFKVSLWDPFYINITFTYILNKIYFLKINNFFFKKKYLKNIVFYQIIF
jgi:hypothetical protein